MAMCFVPNCSHRTGVHKCRMHSFPRSPRKKKKWKRLIRRADTSPTKHARVCSCHFKGCPTTVLPTVFPWNVKKRFHFQSPVSKKRSSNLKRSPQVKKRLFVSHEANRQSESLETDSPLSIASEQASNFGDFEQQRNINISPDDDLLSLHSCEQTNSSGDFEQQNNSRINSDDGLHIVHSPKQTLNFVGTEDHSVLSADAECNTELTSDQIQSLMSKTARLNCEVNRLKEQLAMVTPDVVHVAEVTVLQGEVKRLKAELLDRKDFSFSKISHSCDLVSHYTGLPNRDTFYAVLSLCNNVGVSYCYGWKVTKKVDKETQLFITLLKLRRNFTNLDLSVRFNIGKTTVSNIFISWVLLLHHIFVNTIMSSVPSRQKNQADLPDCFSDYPSTRIVLDCTEVATASPTLLSNQNKMYSHYKHRITSKGLVGIAPNGTVTFVSKLFPGSTSDRKVVVESGVLKCLNPGDSVMADKGFNIDDLMPDGVALNIPPFKETPQCTVDQINRTFRIAKARIHVERAIARIKNFQILCFIPQFFLPYASEIFQVCAALTNLQKPLIKTPLQCDDDV